MTRTSDMADATRNAPTEFSQDLFDKICERIADGESLRITI